MEWISVKDKLPELNQQVLIYKSHEEQGWQFNVCRIVRNIHRNSWDRNEIPTHWMPLPSPPQ